jgi:hypothetical protein
MEYNMVVNGDCVVITNGMQINIHDINQLEKSENKEDKELIDFIDDFTYVSSHPIEKFERLPEYIKNKIFQKYRVKMCKTKVELYNKNYSYNINKN